MPNWLRIAAVVSLLTGLIVAATTPWSGAASSSSVVGADVLSSTQLSMAGCVSAPSRSFGSIATDTPTVTSSDCALTFGSSNSSSSLRLVQADQSDTAMTQWDPSGVVEAGAPKLQGAAARSATEAWVVGESLKTGDAAPIAHTTDGGATWTDQTSCSASARLTAVSYVSASTVVLVGSSNVVCRTTDGGATWTTTGATPSTNWMALDFLPSGEGWAVGSSGRVVRSTNSGSTWTTLASPNAGWLIAGIDAVSSTQLYATAYTNSFPRSVYALASADGGASWTTTLIGDSQYSGSSRAVTALSASTALIGTSYGTYRTTDSGATWSHVSALQPSCLTVTGATTVLAYSHTAAPQRSVDSGATWSPVASPPTINGYIRGCASAATGTAFVAGYNDQRFHTTNDGDTHVVSVSTFRDQAGISAWSSQHLVSVGTAGSVRRSIDGGTSFTSPSSGTAVALRSVVTFEHAGDRVAVLVGGSGVIRRSVDGGATWSAVSSGTAAAIEHVDRSADGTLIAVGAAGLVLRSFDAGVSWHTLPAPSAAALNDVIVRSPADIWVVGAAGAAFRTIDGGSTWQSQTTGTALAITGLDSIDGQNALAVTASNGSTQSGVLRTTDGGATWSLTMTVGPSPNPSYDVQYLDPTRAVIAQTSGYRMSTDTGLTWTAVASNLNQVYAIDRLDTHSFVAAGQNELIGRVLPATGIPDFAFGSNDFSSSAGAFGACLHTATGTTSTSWTLAGAGNCTTAQPGNWRGVGTDTATSGVAARSGSGTASIGLRFGLRAGASQAPGAYAADLRFEVTAP